MSHGTEYGSPIESYYIRIADDTLISEQLYKKVYRSNDSLHVHWFLEGFIRETDTGTVYYLKDEDGIESLLYDFGIDEHDSIQLPDGVDWYLYVDSVRIKPFGIYDEMRKHIFLSDYHSHNCQTWIAGVGSLRIYKK